MKMDTLEITRLLESNLWQPHFFRVLPRDKLKDLEVIFKPTAVVINTGNSNSQGIHWQGLYMSEDCKNCYFFCSLGLDPQFEILQFCKTNNLLLDYKSKCIQNPLAATCGLFACDFILYMSNGGSLLHYSKRFKSGRYAYNEKQLSLSWKIDGNVMKLKYVCSDSV